MLVIFYIFSSHANLACVAFIMYALQKTNKFHSNIYPKQNNDKSDIIITSYLKQMLQIVENLIKKKHRKFTSQTEANQKVEQAEKAR